MIFILILLGVFLLDLMVKKYMEEKLPDELSSSKEDKADAFPKEILGGKVILRKLHNKGVAFGAFGKYPKLVEQGTLGVLAVVFGYFVYLLTRPGQSFKKAGTGMMLGGGLCNWFDRFHQGYVTDYFSFNVKWDKLKNLVFNLSDMFIFLGMFLSLIGKKKK